jgi:hypothetical protein
VETGFDVRPIIQGNQVDIEIVPRISAAGRRSEGGIIRFAEAATRITVPLGQWTPIGDTGQATNEAVSAILSTAKRSQHQALTMSVLVEAQ